MSILARLAAAGSMTLTTTPSCVHKPLTTPAAAHTEVLVFDPPANRSNWKQMDWDQITTLALFSPWPPPDDLYCHAHEHSVKIVKCVVSSLHHLTSSSASTAVGGSQPLARRWLAGRISTQPASPMRQHAASGSKESFRKRYR